MIFNYRKTAGSEPVTRYSAQQLFKLIYDRLPHAKEESLLQTLTAHLPTDNPTMLFRAIVQGFDHQTAATPYSVRLSRADVEFARVGDFEIATDIADIAVGVPLRNGHYEQHMFKFFREHIKPGMTFVDVGANIGCYSMLAAKMVGELGKVYSFEPNSENCRLIMLSQYKNEFDNIELHPVALGNELGRVLFSSAIGSNGGLLRSEQETLWNSNCVVVPVHRLDDMISENVDFIKMDVEGSEGMVVQGASRTIESCRPIVTSEFSLEMLGRVSDISGEDYLSFFKDKNYRINLLNKQTELLEPIDNIKSFVENYGEFTRIEDLVFIPD